MSKPQTRDVFNMAAHNTLQRTISVCSFTTAENPIFLDFFFSNCISFNSIHNAFIKIEFCITFKSQLGIILFTNTPAVLFDDISGATAVSSSKSESSEKPEADINIS